MSSWCACVHLATFLHTNEYVDWWCAWALEHPRLGRQQASPPGSNAICFVGAIGRRCFCSPSTASYRNDCCLFQHRRISHLCHLHKLNQLLIRFANQNVDHPGCLGQSLEEKPCFWYEGSRTCPTSALHHDADVHWAELPRTVQSRRFLFLSGRVRSVVWSTCKASPQGSSSSKKWIPLVGTKQSRNEAGDPSRRVGPPACAASPGLKPPRSSGGSDDSDWDVDGFPAQVRVINVHPRVSTAEPFRMVQPIVDTRVRRKSCLVRVKSQTGTPVFCSRNLLF